MKEKRIWYIELELLTTETNIRKYSIVADTLEEAIKFGREIFGSDREIFKVERNGGQPKVWVNE